MLTSLDGAYNVTKGTQYSSISDAVSDAANGDFIRVGTGLHQEVIDLSRRTNISLIASNWIQNGNNTSAVIRGNGTSPVISLSNAFGCKVIGFTIKNGTYGVFNLSQSPNSNYIAHNLIYSNVIGVGITNGDWNTVTSNNIYHCSNGIYITGTSETNTVFSNTIYSNFLYGIYIDNDNADNNIIRGNNVFANLDTGIRILNADNIIISLNEVYDNTNYGMRIGSGSLNCFIFTNTVYSNGGTVMQEGGIRLDSAHDSVVIGNRVFNNRRSQVYNGSADFVDILNNKITGGDYGIYFDNNAQNNYIYGNTICSQSSTAIRMIWGPCRDNTFNSNLLIGRGVGTGITATGGPFNVFTNNRIAYWSIGVALGSDSWRSNQDLLNNRIYSNTSYAVDINDCGNHNIRRNLLYNNGNGIRVRNNNSYNIRIINNTIFNSILGDGVVWENASWGYLYNNIFLSNNNFGIHRMSTGPVVAGYNDFFGNSFGPTNGGVIWENGNLLNDPAIDTVSSFVILSPLSPAVDSATNILSEPVQGGGLDMGWRESPFTPAIVSKVHVVYQDLWFNTITNAIAAATNGDLIEVYPGTYKEQLRINGMTNLALRAWDWTNSKNNTNTVILVNGFNFVAGLNNCQNVTVQGFLINGQAVAGIKGIMLQNSAHSRIMNNRIISNHDTGIFIDFNSSHNLVSSNIIYNNTGMGMREGITINSTNNKIEYNTVYNQKGGIPLSQNYFGINLAMSSFSNFVRSNSLYSNDHGIHLGGVRNRIENNFITNNNGNGIIITGRTNYIYNNTVRNSKRNGIFFPSSGFNSDNTVVSNFIFSSGTNGITVSDGDNSVFKYNIIEANLNNGIMVKGTDNCLFNNNRIFSNALNGILISSNTAQHTVSDNEIYNNTMSGVALVSNSSKSNLLINNNIYNNDTGIWINNSEKNSIEALNRIHHNINGIEVVNAFSNRISANYITNNSIFGVRFLNSSANNIVTNNLIAKNIKFGILFNSANDNTVIDNNISYNSNAVHVDPGGMNNNIYYNIITHNTNGIYYDFNIGNNILLNTISSNRTGVNVAWIGMVVTPILNKNNITANLTNMINNSGGLFTTETNWLGTTIYSNIEKSMGGIQPIQYVPYRLFGQYDTSIGADTIYPSVVTVLTAEAVMNTNVALRWNSSAGAVRYFIYRNFTDSISNFTKNLVLGRTIGTNWTNYNVPNGNWHYRVTALDDPGTAYTNESWYSTNVSIMIDRNPPYFNNLSPTNNRINVATNGNVVFTVLDNVAVSSQSIIVRIGGTTSFSNGSFLAGFSGSISAFGPGYSMVVDQDAAFPEWIGINVYLYGEDTLGNANSLSFVFTTTDSILPAQVNLISPDNNVFTNTNIIELLWNSIIDSGSGISNYQVQLSMNNFSTVWSNKIISVTNTFFTNLLLGTNWWRARAIDRAGHVGPWSATNSFKKELFYGELAYFNILHQTNYSLGTYGDFILQAITTNGGMPNPLLDYTGTATISVIGTGSTIDWSNSSGVGTLTTNANGNAVFQFIPANAGVVTLNIRDYTTESVNVDVNDALIRDLDTEGPLYFQPSNPYIVSMSVLRNGYATVDEINSLSILFSRVVSPSAVTNFFFYDMDNNPYSLTFSLTTNTNGTIPRTEITLSPGLGQAEILKGYWMEIRTNIIGTNGSTLIDNPFNSMYNIPFYSTYTTMIDKDIGGTVRNMLLNTTLLIDPDVLPDDAYVSVKDISPADNAAVALADSKVTGSQSLKKITTENMYRDITAFNRALGAVNVLNNSAQLFINYSDADNDGLVDGTNILEEWLTLLVLNEQTGEWEPIENSYVDTANNKVYGNITRFGIYTVMGYYEATNFEDSFITYPNPADIKNYKVSIKFYLEKDAKMTMKIFTLTGELVKTLSDGQTFSGTTRHILQWNGKNDAGVEVVNGVYLIHVKGGFLNNSGKFSKTWKQGIVK